MVDLVNWVRGRLGNRPDSEHGQAIVRIVLIVLILGFVLLPSTRAQPDLEQYQGVLAIVLSGLVLWKSVQFPLLRELLGGYEAARREHFLAMAALVAFFVVHIVMVALVPRTLLAMIRGR